MDDSNEYDRYDDIESFRRLSVPNVIITNYPDVTTPESPKEFLNSVDKGVYVIKTPEQNYQHKNRLTPDSDAVSKATTRSESKIEKTRSRSTIAGSDHTQVYGEDENEERGNWTGRFDFLLSMLGYSVGLGNIWRFPYLCYKNGGGAFLIPYVIMLLVVGIPLFYLETCIGQFSSRGPLSCWGFAPLFQGLGVAMVIISGIVTLYYNMIVSWAILYFFASFTSSLPWSTCENPWNTKDCSLKLPRVNCTVTEGVKYTNGTCYNREKFVGLWNTTQFTTSTGRLRITPSEEYWNNYVLGISSGIDDMGPPRWQLTLSLFGAWFLCFLCLIKGIKTTGKVVYFTAIFPYVVLIILFFRGVTLPNASEGIYFYIVPTFDKLLDAKVWRDGAVQVFYSLGPGWGGLIALSSYNRFHNNILGDAIIVSLGDGLTSIFGGFVVFSYLGYMAGQLGVGVKDVARSGAGLAFVVYPEAVNNLPPPTLWSLLFFFMLITLGLDSEFAMLETVLTGLTDYFPSLRPKKSFVILFVCIFCFLLGLPITTSGGMYWLQLLDHYVGSWSLLVIGLTELMVINLIYGINRFLSDIEVMQGYRPSIWWKICWLGISPAGMVFILVFSFVDYSPITYDAYVYPAWAEALGWLLSLCSIIFIPIVIIYKISKENDEKGLINKVKLLLAPSRDWGPALVKHRELVDYVEGFVLDPEKEKQELSFINYGYNTSVSNLQTTSSATPSEASIDPSVDTRRTYLSRTLSHVSYETTI
ncbi:sodium-dependent proline transporter-like [Mizuhopecten yessoensis]|uniref:Transporter n=1 Tax=Mizuhopecten yessoensis TaxID=6573 RepID=A0A210Q798_MIZYE|nr:sodium-dependent proline transporter-like [Mizuhopecten yessoensis]OWF44595.1 Sodium- and chloride-dependent glycine transporter 2 [Mizuhopecten yessoensis]